MSDESWITFPISGTFIAIIVLTPILCILGGMNATLAFLSSNLIPIIIFLSAIALTLSIIPTVKSRNLLFLLSGVVVTTQLIVYLYFGLNAVIAIGSSGFILIWRLVVFALWIIYGCINIVISYLAMGMACLVGAKSGNHKASPFFGGIVGLIGWGINFVIFVIF